MSRRTLSLSLVVMIALSVGVVTVAVPTNATTTDAEVPEGEGRSVPTGEEDANVAVEALAQTTDGTAPTLESTDPIDDSTGHPTDGDITLTFNEDIEFGPTGTVDVVDDGDGSSTQTLEVGSSGLSISGKTLTIDPSSDLEFATSYHVEITSGTVEDTSSNDYGGFTDSTTLNFETVTPDPGPDETPPSIELDVPENATAGESVSMDAFGTTDNRDEHYELDFDWSFGDGGNATTDSVSHTYDSAGTYTVELTVTDTSGNTATETATIDVGPDPKATVAIDESVIGEERGDVVEFGLALSNTDTATLSIGDLSSNSWIQNLTVRDGNGDGRVTLEFNTYTAGARGYADRTYDTRDDADSIVEVRPGRGAFSPDTPEEDTLAADDYAVEAVAGDVDTLQGRDTDAVATLTLGARSTDSLDVWVAPHDRPPRTLDGIQELMASGNLTRTETVATGEYMVAAVEMNGIEGILKNGTDGPADNLTDAFLRETVDGLGNASLSSYTAGDLPRRVRHAAFALTVNVTDPGPNAGRTELVTSQDALKLIDDPANSTYYLVYDLGAQTRTSDGDDIQTTLTVLDHDDVGDNVSVTESNITFQEPSASVDADADTDGDGQTDELTVEAAPGGTITGTANVAPGTDLTVRVRGTSLASPFLKPLTARVRPDRTWTATGDFGDVAAGANFTVQVLRDGEPLLDTTVDGRVVEPSASVRFENQTTDGTNVTVASVTASVGGFVAIWEKENRDILDTILGSSEFLASGAHSDVVVDLDRRLAEEKRLAAVVYRDPDGDRKFDVDESLIYTRNFSAVFDTATVTPVASITFENQTTDGTNVTVASVTTPSGGFVTIHNGSASGEVLGSSEFLDSGSQSDISVPLDRTLEEDRRVVAVVYRDANGDGEFNRSVDAPYTSNGSPVSHSALVRLDTSPDNRTTPDNRTSPGNTRTPGPVTTTVGGITTTVGTTTTQGGSGAPARRYDEDGDGGINITELGEAASDYAIRSLSIRELGEIAAIYARSQSDNGTDVPGTSGGPTTNGTGGADTGQTANGGTGTAGTSTTFFGALQTAGAPVFGAFNVGLSLLLGAYLVRRQGIDAGPADEDGERNRSESPDG